MPIGVICNALAVAIGGIIGAMAGKKLSHEIKEKLNLIFAVCSMGMGVASIVLMENMPVVILALVLGTILGVSIHLGALIERGGVRLEKLMSSWMGGNPASFRGTEEDQSALLVTAVVLFCSSGTGIYGSIVSGISGDHSILITKSILDLFTALIFACSLGMVVSSIAVPQLMIFGVLFASAKLIFPLTTPSMINDFKACGGFIMLATGFRIAKVKMFPIADMIPGMVLVFPLHWMWVSFILPMLS